VAAAEADAAARLIERLLAEPALRSRFRRDPAAACRDAGLHELAEEMALGAGKAMYTLDVRESKSSLAGVMMAAAVEGVGIYEFSAHVLPHLEDAPGRVADVLSRVSLPAVGGGGGRGGGGAALAAAGVPGRGGHVAPGAAAAHAAAPEPAPLPSGPVAEKPVVLVGRDGKAVHHAAPPAPQAAAPQEVAPAAAPHEAAQAAAPAPAGAPAVSHHIDPSQFGAAGTGTGGSASPETLALLHNKNVVFDSAGVSDLKAGRIDPRVVAILTHLSHEHKLVISCMCSDHSRFTSGGSVSNHTLGRGVDIASVDGQIVNAGNPIAREIAGELSSVEAAYRPNEIGSPWAISGPGYFTDAEHQNHLHIGFKQAISPDWTPPVDVAAPSDGAASPAAAPAVAAPAEAAAPAPTPAAPAPTPAAPKDTLGFISASAKAAGAPRAQPRSGDSLTFLKAVDPKTPQAATPGPSGDAAAAAVEVTGAPDRYPGDNAPREQIAAWMAAQAQQRGLPPELPVMASLVESGMRNLHFGDADFVGFYQMRVGIWNHGPYAGYPDKPELQVKWFLDQAEAVKRQRIAAGKSTTDPHQYGDWIADIEQPAAQYRGRYQLQLDNAEALLKAHHHAAPAPAPAEAPSAGGGGGSSLGAAALRVAQTQRGVREIGSTNTGPQVDDYLAAAGVPPGNPWCASFVTWAMQHAGHKMPGGGWAAVSTWVHNAEQGSNGLKVVTAAEARPGDIVAYDWGGQSDFGADGHIGFLASGVNGGRFTALEGNNADAVNLVPRHLGGGPNIVFIRADGHASSGAGAPPADPGQAPAAAAAAPPAPSDAAKVAAARNEAEAREHGTLLFRALRAQEARKQPAATLSFAKAAEPQQPAAAPASAAPAPSGDPGAAAVDATPAPAAVPAGVHLTGAVADAVAAATRAGEGPGPRALLALQEAEKYLGTPYHWGGSTPQTGFDCSGLMQWAYAHAGIKLPRVSEDQVLAGNGTPVDRDHLRPGDLVFFDENGDIGHVGMYIGKDEILHAPHTGDVVKIANLDDPWFVQHFAGGRRFDQAAATAAAPSAVDPTEVANAHAAVARDAAEVQRPGTLLFHAVKAQEARKERMTVQFMKAIDPSQVKRTAAAEPPAPAAAVADAAGAGAGAGYPGDSASQAQLARWLAAQAHKAGLPPELPVMASLVESGVRNLNFGDADSVGFFQMRVGIWDNGPYAGFPHKPELQVKWFIDHALAVKRQAIASGNADFGKDPARFGDWIADVEQPAAQFRGRYQLRLDEARRLLAG
jgi:cell wall-associated NlpC family hydrolase